MAIVGSTDNANKEILRGYEQDSMHETAARFVELARAAKQESGLDIFNNPTEFLTNNLGKEDLKSFFVNESYDAEDPRFKGNSAALRSHLENMEMLFENDVQAAVTESTNLGALSPVIGMVTPIHKNILMNAVYDQVMPKDVSRSPKFTLTMETRNLVDTKGNKIDMYAEQNLIKKAIDESVPTFDKVITTLPEQEATDFVAEAVAANVIDASVQSIANLSMRTEVFGVVVKNVYVEKGEMVWDATQQKEVPATAAGANSVLFKLHAFFTPGYGDHVRQMHRAFMISFKKNATDTVTASGTIMGYLNEKNRMLLQCGPLKVKDGVTEAFDTTTFLVEALVVRAVFDVSSAAFPTVKVEWSSTTDIFQIPEAPHVTVPITPEEVKDVQALYDVNQVTKLMSMIRLALLHWKDDSIRDDLDASYLAMPESKQYKAAFDFTPPINFTGLPVVWRNGQFMDRLETMVTEMLQELNDENMTIAIFGRPDLIRRIAPQQYTYQTASNIGPVELDFTRTVVTSEHRVYNFISTNKMRNNNNFVVLLIPRNSMRITYKVVDYQMYLSNEIRDARQTALPAMTAFERWLFLQYQPVQGRMHIMNPTGLRNNPEDDVKDFIGANAMNDYTANRADYANEVNGVVDPATGHFQIPPIKTN